ncbi:ADP-ribosyl cyclase/cyclic ADP-ribose hydrolase [Citrus sinensis]|uniref:ADP-ribosyl cyclase/cyclic ADP-ribose hydrolase n=1 Tax=Citrus sinensis TaxID=2711 RepID=A0ACB8NBY7_CITSI|nr:ADP-ribosyl cyclase/cyclic ADP-ribose hydrolase [Citrus sinensis]
MALSSSFCSPRKYDVFLSFRGEDTRNNFTSHLFAAFCREKIKAFIDEQLKKGDDISSALLNAIEESKISVIIFSKGYASSTWCLEELVKILECKKRKGQTVIPVFYNVDPSDVRNQTGSFGDAFVEHENDFRDMPQKVHKWRAALTQASNLCGWDSMTIRHEAELVDEIVKDILKKIHDISHFGNSEDLVGVDSHIQRINSLLCIGLPDFRMVRPWDMHGIAKTDIARAILNQISSQFEGGLSRFGHGSRVIVTTRDKKVLDKYGVDYVYKVEGFNYRESLEIFCNYAFRQNHFPEDLLVLSDNVVDYANGSSLALKVLGSSFYRKSKQHWENALHNPKQISDPDIHDMLKISYDELNYKEKDLFLDIACFFNGEGRDYVKIILNNRYLVHYGLNILAGKALITISNNKLQMRDLLQEMGQRVVCHESYKDPGKYSSCLWYHEDVYHVRKKNKGTNSIEGMSLDMSKEAFKIKWIDLHHSRDSAKIPYSSELPNLERTELLNCRKLPYVVPPIHNFNHLSSLCLEGCKSPKQFPSNTHFRSPIAVNFSLCINLTEFPQITGNSLDLRGNEFKTLPQSIKQLSQLRFLYLSSCIMLQSWPELPFSVSYLKAKNCKQLQYSLPELPSCLQELDASEGCQHLRGSSFHRVEFIFADWLKLNQANPLADLRLEYGASYQRSLISRAFLSGSSVEVEHLLTIQLPLHWCTIQRLIGFSLCVVTEFEETLAAGRDYFRVKCRSNFETKTVCESETKFLEGFYNLTVAMTIGFKI